MTERARCTCIAPDHPALPGHFPGHPIVPGVVLLSEVEAAVRQQYGARIEKLVSVKFLQPLPPSVPFTLTLEPAAGGGVRFALCDADGSTIATGHLHLAQPEPAP